jgi:hypothetical protein
MAVHNVVALASSELSWTWGGFFVVVGGTFVLIGLPLLIAWWRGYFSGAIGGGKPTVSAVGEPNEFDELDRKLRRPRIWIFDR